MGLVLGIIFFVSAVNFSVANSVFVEHKTYDETPPQKIEVIHDEQE